MSDLSLICLRLAARATGAPDPQGPKAPAPLSCASLLAFGMLRNLFANARNAKEVN